MKKHSTAIEEINEAISLMQTIDSDQLKLAADLLNRNYTRRQLPPFQLFLAMSELLDRMGQLERSANVLIEGYLHYPSETQFAEKLGMVYSRLAKWSYAALYYRKALDFNPTNRDLMYSLAICCLNSRQKIQAVNLFHKIISAGLDRLSLDAQENLNMILEEPQKLAEHDFGLFVYTAGAWQRCRLNNCEGIFVPAGQGKFFTESVFQQDYNCISCGRTIKIDFNISLSQEENK